MNFFHDKLMLEVPKSVYYPREDSLLLAKVLEKGNLKKKRVLEIGCGSGFLAIIMAKSKAVVTAVDIDKDAVKATESNAKQNNVEVTCLNSDLFSAINGKFDLLVFNPPYLPDESNDKTYAGGRTGRETIERFIKQARAHFNTNGKILLLISSLTGEKEVMSLFYKHGFKTRIVSREKVPWEELIVVEACAP